MSGVCQVDVKYNVTMTTKTRVHAHSNYNSLLYNMISFVWFYNVDTCPAILHTQLCSSFKKVRFH